MAAIVCCAISFASGLAGLLFETLWFRVAGLALGSGVWASSLVLGAFMAGLTVGNLAAVRWGDRLQRPLRLYAAVELAVGATALAVVSFLPPLTPALGRAFSHTLGHGWLVNALRLGVAFAFMIVPAAGMGLTTPLLTRALSGRDDNFGRVLGRLYGWNTGGAMVGALCGELWLIPWLGRRGAALVAGTLNGVAAAGAWAVARGVVEIAAITGQALPSPAGAVGRPVGLRAWRLLGAAALTGAALLGLEVVWFRFLQLFVFGTSFIFAAMLSVILLGIALGAVLAARWLGRDRHAHRFAPFVAVAAGVSVALTYALFDPRVDGVVFTTGNYLRAAKLFLRLMLPTTVLSGALFTLLGSAERLACAGASEATGKLALANTSGATVGALLSGFVLIPRLGIEKTLFASVLGYGVIALLVMGPGGRYRRLVQPAAVALFAIGAAFYPFGSMKGRFIPLVVERYQKGGARVLTVKEGLTETVIYLRNSFRDRPLYHRLMTNGHSMSASTYRGRRYMKLYAYWALAVNPKARHALLISYGIGTTAKALVDTRQLESIDVVDISRDILALGGLAFPGAEPPLADPRVRVHVEDGRFFLQTTDETFDLITAEPPPPRGAGITNLYSLEYFRLVHDRLREGGVVTYWLPVNQLWPSEAKAIMRGFCAAFPDCSLWSGAGLQWMLAGTRGARGPIAEGAFSAQWHDPIVGPELISLGLETPESLGATFLADAATLDAWTEGVAPLDDDHPGRMRVDYPTDPIGDPSYRDWMQPDGIRQRFEASPWIRDLWPEALRLRTAEYFAPQATFDELATWGRLDPVESLHDALTGTSLRTLPLLLMGTEPDMQRIALPLYEAGQRDAELELEVGARAMSERDYERAAVHFAAVSSGPRQVRAQILRGLALHLLGRDTEARQALRSVAGLPMSPVEAKGGRWLMGLVERERHGPAHDAGQGGGAVQSPPR